MPKDYDLIVVGGGSGGLTAAGFAVQLGARVALIEKDRIGGDCTWHGCIPSKALLRVSRIAKEIRNASSFGLNTGRVVADMPAVRRYVQQAIAEVYKHESPEELAKKGIELFFGAGHFISPHEMRVDDQVVRGRRFLLTTGARPAVPPIPGLSEVPFLTYEQIFQNDWLPPRLIILGAGPTGTELAQAYQRLGSSVTLIDRWILPQLDPDASAVVGHVLQSEGVQYLKGLATSVEMRGNEVVVQVGSEERSGDALLVATGRRPNIDGLGLETAGIRTSDAGIVVNDYLQTSASHIYAAGDVTGGPQFTLFAGWQGFQAVRNALLPGRRNGLEKAVPETIFTDPEVAYVGLTEHAARQRYGSRVQATLRPMARSDRAVCENDTAGFVKVVHKANGTILGATVVAARAGEVITEFVLAIEHNLKLRDLANAIHAYPAYSAAVMRLAAETSTQEFLAGVGGAISRRLSRVVTYVT